MNRLYDSFLLLGVRLDEVLNQFFSPELYLADRVLGGDPDSAVPVKAFLVVLEPGEHHFEVALGVCLFGVVFGEDVGEDLVDKGVWLLLLELCQVGELGDQVLKEAVFGVREGWAPAFGQDLNEAQDQ